jgi:hypothetical protein
LFPEDSSVPAARRGLPLEDAAEGPVARGVPPTEGPAAMIPATRVVFPDKGAVAVGPEPLDGPTVEGATAIASSIRAVPPVEVPAVGICSTGARADCSSDAASL